VVAYLLVWITPHCASGCKFIFLFGKYQVIPAVGTSASFSDSINLYWLLNGTIPRSNSRQYFDYFSQSLRQTLWYYTGYDSFHPLVWVNEHRCHHFRYSVEWWDERWKKNRKRSGSGRGLYQLLCRHLTGGAEVNNKKLNSVKPVPRPPVKREYTEQFYVYGSVHRWSILIIVQRDATQRSLFIILQVHSTCFGCQAHSSSGVHKTVTAAAQYWRL